MVSPSFLSLTLPGLPHVLPTLFFLIFVMNTPLNPSLFPLNLSLYSSALSLPYLLVYLSFSSPLYSQFLLQIHPSIVFHVISFSSPVLSSVIHFLLWFPFSFHILSSTFVTQTSSVRLSNRLLHLFFPLVFVSLIGFLSPFPSPFHLFLISLPSLVVAPPSTSLSFTLSTLFFIYSYPVLSSFSYTSFCSLYAFSPLFYLFCIFSTFYLPSSIQSILHFFVHFFSSVFLIFSFLIFSSLSAPLSFCSLPLFLISLFPLFTSTFSFFSLFTNYFPRLVSLIFFV